MVGKAPQIRMEPTRHDARVMILTRHTGSFGGSRGSRHATAEAVSAQRVEVRDGGITYYNKSRAVDVPFIATLSEDESWVVASFARVAGNVWSNPELTCQHVEPQMSLQPGELVAREVKLLVIRGTLDDALQRALRQRESLK